MTPKRRFMIFERDKYKCQYCGRSAPDVMLEIDHIVPRASGGTDDLSNLKTACRECNRGKGSLEQSDVVQRIVNMKIRETDMKLKKYFYDSRNKKGFGKIENDTNILVNVWLSVCMQYDRYQGSLDKNNRMREYQLYQEGGAFVDEVMNRILEEEKVWRVDTMLDEISEGTEPILINSKNYEDSLHRRLIYMLSINEDGHKILESRFIRYKNLLC